MLKWLQFISVSLLICCPVGAQQITLNLDPQKSTIAWTLGGNVHTVHGTFRFKTGLVTVNRGSGRISGEVVADAVSGESGNAARDKRMHKEILESSQFSDITLMPKRAEGTINTAGQSQVMVSGEVKIHGTVHTLTIPMSLIFSGNTATVRGEFSIPYVEWGMKDPSNFLFKVDKSVKVEVVAIGTVKEAAEGK